MTESTWEITPVPGTDQVKVRKDGQPYAVTSPYGWASLADRYPHFEYVQEMRKYEAANSVPTAATG